MTSGSGEDTPARVAVIRGGDSSEREVSLRTGRAVVEALTGAPCDVLEYDTLPDLGQRLEDDGVDVVFLALHGPGGEDGTIQGMLDWRSIPYTGPGPAASAICMDKLWTRRFAGALGVPSPGWFYLAANESIHNKEGFDRMVVKPRFEGSSVGISVTSRENLEGAVEKARRHGGGAIVEEYLDGPDATVGVVHLEETRVFPPISIHPPEGFYDYEAKYTPGATEYRVPAELPETTLERLRSLTGEVAAMFETESLCRVDYRLDEQGEPRMLEINTIPGMTETSLLPRAAAAAGLTFEELVWSMVRHAGERSRWEPA